MTTLLADRYEVIRQLGSGSFGHTFLARDREQDRQVAVKVFNPQAATDWKAQQLFEREAAVLRALRHHGVPEIHDYRRTEQDGTTVALLVRGLNPPSIPASIRACWIPRFTNAELIWPSNIR